jgi:hypothetical protein
MDLRTFRRNGPGLAECESEAAWRRLWAERRGPRPAPWLPCTMCTWLKWLVAYERIGWLVPPPKPTRKPRRQRSREEILHEQVKRTERELARLRRELKEVTSAPAQSSTDNASPSARQGKPGR